MTPDSDCCRCTRPPPPLPTVTQSRLSRLFDNRNVLGLLFMLPAGALLLFFLTYPLGLGVWLGFTDAKIGRAGEWIGIENYEYLVTDSVFRLSVFNTFLYTVVASVIKFVLGLWLALLLNKHIPFKSFVRAIVLLPFIVPTVLSAIAFWWIYDAQFSIVSWALVKMGLIDHYIDFLGSPISRGCRPSSPTSGAACRSSPSVCWRACRPSRRRCTRRPASTVPRRPAVPACDPADAFARSSPWS